MFKTFFKAIVLCCTCMMMDSFGNGQAISGYNDTAGNKKAIPISRMDRILLRMRQDSIDNRARFVQDSSNSAVRAMLADSFTQINNMIIWELAGKLDTSIADSMFTMVRGLPSYTITEDEIMNWNGAYAGVATKLNIADTTGKWLSSAYVPTWNVITGKPPLFSGSYTDLSNKPALFSGAYADLTGKPAIPDISGKLNISDTTGKWKPASYVAPVFSVQGRVGAVTLISSDITTALGFTPISSVPAQTWASITGKPTVVSAFTNDAGYITSIPAQSWSSITGKPSFSAVATTGAYSDLTGLPTITTYTAGTGISIASGVISTSGMTAVTLPTVNVTETAVVAIALGWRNVTVTCAGVLAGDRIQINPTSAPTGYAIGQAVATANNTLQVQVYAPLLAIGSSYTIQCKILAFR